MSKPTKSKTALAPKRHAAKAERNTSPKLLPSRYDVIEILSSPDDCQIKNLPTGDW
jgi:hypothetical protein